MFKQFPEIPSRFIHTDKVKGENTYLFCQQHIEYLYQYFSEIFNEILKSTTNIDAD